MKKIIIITFILLITGCSSKEKQFKQLATKYYNDHMSMINNVDQVTITLSDLEKSNEYDLKKFKKCDKNSWVIFDISEKNIKNAKISLKC
ncbi:MAG: hypothetical protein J6D28_03475 [Bacilli bacterium]|nr:hypothetical protein [Bacilli bacterium]